MKFNSSRVIRIDGISVCVRDTIITSSEPNKERDNTLASCSADHARRVWENTREFLTCSREKHVIFDVRPHL